MFRVSIAPERVQHRRLTGSGAIRMRRAVEICIAFIDRNQENESLNEPLKIEHLSVVLMTSVFVL